MSTAEFQNLADALRRLWSSLIICCWIIALAIGIQILVWALASFTDLRFRNVSAGESGVRIALAETVTDRPVLTDGAPPLPVAPVENIRVQTKYNFLFRDLSSIALAAGTLATIIMVLMAMVMVVIIAASASPGVDEAVAAMTWTVIVAALALPLGAAFGLPWQGSGLRQYDIIVAQVDLAQSTGAGVTYYLKFLLMPVCCLIGTVLISFRFGHAARKALPGPLPFLDPELEKEASEVDATSLHGSGRAAGALNRLVDAGKEKELKETVKNQSEKTVPSATQVSAGEPLRRPI